MYAATTQEKVRDLLDRYYRAARERERSREGRMRDEEERATPFTSTDRGRATSPTQRVPLLDVTLEFVITDENRREDPGGGGGGGGGDGSLAAAAAAAVKSVVECDVDVDVDMRSGRRLSMTSHVTATGAGAGLQQRQVWGWTSDTDDESLAGSAGSLLSAASRASSAAELCARTHSPAR